MTEWEKSQNGQPHIFDSELMEKYLTAMELTNEYNQAGVRDAAQKQTILQRLLKQAGKNLQIIPEFHCEFGSNISIGDHVIINFNCILMDNTEITIGDHVLIGPNVSMYTVNHALAPEERAQGICINKPIHIGNRVWISGDVVITAGVRVGDDSVIGAGSVVTKDIPSGVIAAGNPCRVIRAIRPTDKLLGR